MMLELSRTVRFGLSPDEGDDQTPRDNTFSAWPAVRGLGRYYELHVACRGEADPATGYFINIKHIDTAVREGVLPILRSAIGRDGRGGAGVAMGRLMREGFEALQPRLGGSVVRVGLQLAPTLELAVTREGLEVGDMGEVLVKQQYEFSAAHRLHVPGRSDAENRATFGKCNNPAGHGHNYRVEVTVRSPIDASGRTLDVAALDAVVDARVIEKLDHKHLNHDVPEFAERNPSVEHIAQVVWGMLGPGLGGALAGAELAEVAVWETGKTVCVYRGEGAASV
ncbi:MAG: 6-carboxytetrahydropterin synthase [Planctomycetota bacterium]